MEPRSNTMKLGVHNATLASSLALADQVVVHCPSELGEDFAGIFTAADNVAVADDYEALVDALEQTVRPGDHMVFMSNGGFGGVREKLTQRLRTSVPAAEEKP